MIVPEVAHPPDYLSLADGGECGKLIRDFDWASSPIGPREHWPSSLRTIVNTVLTTPFKSGLFWGPERVMVYNDNYSMILGPNHPAALGKAAASVWEDSIWKEIKPDIDMAYSGLSVHQSGKQFFFVRPTYIMEAYYVFTLSPVINEQGTVQGVLALCIEETARYLHERREACLRELGSRRGEALTLKQTCVAAAETFEKAKADIPFSLIYLKNDNKNDNKSDTACTLVATSGIAADHPMTASTSWPLESVLHIGEAVELVNLHHTNLPGGIWPENTTEAVIVPLYGVSQGRTIGAAVLGVSARRKIDEASRGFHLLIQRQISSNLSIAENQAAERFRREEMERLDRAKTSFFSSVSHELRTPLTLILGPLRQLLTDSALSPTVKEELAVMNRNAQRLLKLVTGLLDFSRVEAGRMQAVYRPTDLGLMIADLCAVFRSAIERANLAFHVEIDPVSDPIYVDAEMIEKAMYNLLSNALKCTFEGSISVRFGKNAAGNAVFVTVQDTGTGIPAEEVPRVFERFHRVEHVYKRSSEGTGIGLALTQELVKLHGGNISVRSTLGDGSSFTMTFPIGKEHLSPEFVDEAHRNYRSSSAIDAQFLEEANGWLPHDALQQAVLCNESSAAEPTSILPVTWTLTGAGDDAAPPPYILVVDDNRDMATYVKSLLSPFWSVKIAQDGQKAMEMALQRAPGIIISDVMMPLVDGFELIKQIRANTALSLIPVILLSARAGDESRVEGLSRGADDYLSKPFNARELLARVRIHLELGRLRGELQTQLNEAEENRKGLSTFIDYVCHELRNPLSGVLGNVDLLRSSLLARKAVADSLSAENSGYEEVWNKEFSETIYKHLEWDSESLDAIESCALHQKVIADDVLHMSKLKSGTFSTIAVLFFAPAVVQKTIDMFATQIRKKQVDLTVETSGWKEGNVLGDPERIGQVIINLLSNAIKFTERSTTRRIRVVLESSALPAPEMEKVNMKVSVEDTGIGMTPAAQENLFDRFSPASIRTHREYGGTGLGLHISKQMLAVMGGDISVKSEAGKGTKFTFSVPVTRDTHPQETAAAPPPPASARPLPRDSMPAKVDGSGVVVLIAEDNLINQRLLKRQLDLLHFTTILADNGQQAVDIFTKAEEGSIHAILMDSEMPLKGGIEATLEIRALEAARRAAANTPPRVTRGWTPIIGLSGNARAEHREQALNAGQSLYLTKPYNTAALVAAIVDLAEQTAA
ncbi:hypothetical protein HDU86_007300 [Geranomyces michiganensis]|nr:hypothetical protein HDU86_007300 [Geranomyces michiganensis]